MSHKVYLGLGSNLGDRDAMLRGALSLLQKRVGSLIRVSPFMETEPWGFQSAHPFLNAVALMLTGLSPHSLLAATQEVEQEMGRTEKTEGSAYHDRPIDIDILLYDNLSIDTPDLTIPHPLMQERDFVMVPLREVMKADTDYKKL